MVFREPALTSPDARPRTLSGASSLHPIMSALALTLARVLESYFAR
jgi:hypothetical protein